MDAALDEPVTKLRDILDADDWTLPMSVGSRLTQSGAEVETLLSSVLKSECDQSEDATSDAVAKQQAAVDEVLYKAVVRLETELSKKERDTTEETEIEVNLLARLEQSLEYCSHRLGNKTISLEVLLLLSVVLDPNASFNKADTWSSRSSYSKGSILAQLINHFGACGGFELVRQRLRHARDLSIAHLAALLRPFGQCYQQLTADTIKSYFLPTVDSVCSHLLSCSDRQLFQQDIPVGELTASLVGPRAAYVIVEAVMNLLSSVKTEEVEAQVKVQYWQDTILTRLKHALEDEASSGECSPSGTNGRGQSGTSSPQGQVSRRTSHESQRDVTTPGSISEVESEMKSPTSLSSRSCQTLPCVMNAVTQETLELIERLAKENTKSPVKEPSTPVSPGGQTDTSSEAETAASDGDFSASRQMITIDIEPPSPRPPHSAAPTIDASVDLDMPSTSYGGIVDLPSHFPFDLSSDVIVWNPARMDSLTATGSGLPSSDSKHIPHGIGLDSSDTSSMVSMTSVARSASELGLTCRVCFEGETSSKNRLIRPCRCKGSAASIHRQCLVKWMQISRNRYCEVCNARFSHVPLSEHMRGFVEKFHNNRRWRNIAFAVLVGLVVILYLIIFAVFPGGIMNA